MQMNCIIYFIEYPAEFFLTFSERFLRILALGNVEPIDVYIVLSDNWSNGKEICFFTYRFFQFKLRTAIYCFIKDLLKKFLDLCTDG